MSGTLALVREDEKLISHSVEQRIFVYGATFGDSSCVRMTNLRLMLFSDFVFKKNK